jgi:hypothetical protein
MLHKFALVSDYPIAPGNFCALSHIRRERLLKSAEINVETYKGIVRLSGPSCESRSEAPIAARDRGARETAAVLQSLW